MNVLQFFNTLLLAGIFVVLVLIFVGLRQPIAVREPVSIEGWSGLLIRENTPEPVLVKIQPNG